MKGLYFAFQSDFGKIAEVLPDLLEPAAPFVVGGITYTEKPNSGDSYREAMLGVYARYMGQTGIYPVNFLVNSADTEPKPDNCPEKAVQNITVCRNKNDIRFEKKEDILRGITEYEKEKILDISMKTGKFNNPAAEAIFQKPVQGMVSGIMNLFSQLLFVPDKDEQRRFTCLPANKQFRDGICRIWQPAEIAMRLESGGSIKWGDFPVFGNLGGIYTEYDPEV